jgi:hypothetical protein
MEYRSDSNIPEIPVNITSLNNPIMMGNLDTSVDLQVEIQINQINQIFLMVFMGNWKLRL